MANGRTKEAHVRSINKGKPKAVSNITDNLICHYASRHKVVDTDTQEKVTTEEEKLKAVLFLIQAYESIYG